MLADCVPSVVSITAQLFQLHGADGDRVRRHVADLLLMDRSGGVTVADVKAPHKRDDPQVQVLTTWTRETVALRGWGFELWSGESRQVLANVGFLAGYRREPVIDQSLTPEVRAAVGAAATVADVERILRDRDGALVRPMLLHLWWRGLFTTDLIGPLGGLSVVHPGNESGAVEMTGQSVLLQAGARFAFDGEIVEVMALDGARVSVRDARRRWQTVSLPGFLARAAAAGDPVPVESVGTRLAALSAEQRSG